MVINKEKHQVEQHGLTLEWTYDRADPNYPGPKMAVCQYSLWVRVLSGRWVRPPHPYRSLMRFIDFVENAQNPEEIVAGLLLEANTSL
jgi:hypothetical protein